MQEDGRSSTAAAPWKAGLREQEEGRSSTAAAPWKASVQQGPQAQLNKDELDY